MAALGWTVPLLFVGSLIASMVGLGVDAPIVPEPLHTEDAPVEAAADLAPGRGVLFTGNIAVADPSRHVFSAEPLLWRESCHILRLQQPGYRQATLSLDAGATEGLQEDLDLYVWNDSRTIVASATSPTTGIGVHHELALPSDAAELVVCLAGGAQARYVTAVS